MEAQNILKWAVVSLRHMPNIAALNSWAVFNNLQYILAMHLLLLRGTSWYCMCFWFFFFFFLRENNALYLHLQCLFSCMGFNVWHEIPFQYFLSKFDFKLMFVMWSVLYLYVFLVLFVIFNIFLLLSTYALYIYIY